MIHQPSLISLSAEPHNPAWGGESRSWHLGRAAVALLIVVPAVQPLFAEGGAIPLATRVWASVLWVAALAPAWHYLSVPAEQRRPIPFFPAVGLLYGLYYALPVLLDAELLNYAVWIDPQRDYQPAIEAALLGWAAVLAGYAVTRRPSAWPAFQRLALPDAAAPKWAFRLLVTGVTVRFVVATVPAAQILGGLAWFLSSLATFGLAILIIQWRRRQLSRLYKGLTVAGLSTLVVAEVGTGLVATLIFVLAAVAMAYWAASPARLKPAAIAVLLTVAGFVLVFKGVTADFRAVAWSGGTTLSVVDRAELAGSLVRNRVAAMGARDALASGTDAATARSSNADLIAEIIRRTPADVPYWNGETYLSLVGLFIPRFLWPDKPVKNLGQDFGHRYGFLDASDTITSFNFPWLVEGYANFAWAGVILIGFTVGMIYAALSRLVNIPGQSVWSTAAGIVVLTPLLNIESDFSLTFGGLPLTLATLWVIMWWISSGNRPQADARAVAL